jgi:hemoglobin-like flavoprotein
VTPEQKQLLLSSLATLLADAETAANLFYTYLFEENPGLRALFKGSIKHQGYRFIQMLAVTLASIDSLDNVVPVLWSLGKRHGGYGVTPAHYDDFEVALFRTLKQQLGDDFTPEVRVAWAELYHLISSTMKQAASEGAIPR